MMNIFSFEDDAAKDNQDLDDDTSGLLINKLIKYAQVKKESEGISATADIIKQRDQLKEKLKDEFKKEDDNSEDSDKGEEDKKEEDKDDSELGSGGLTDEEANEDIKPDDKGEEDTDKDSDDSDKENSDKDSDDKDDKEEPQANDSDEEEDSTEHAKDPDSLRAIIGSKAGSKKSDKPVEKEKPKDSKEEEKDPLSLDHYKDKTIPFSPIKQFQLSYESYIRSLTNKRALSFEELPVAYTKEAILAALNKVIGLCNTYSSLTDKVVEKRLNGLKQINESSSIVSMAYKNEKLHLNNKVVEDRDLLVRLVNSTDSEVVKVSNLVLKYMKTASTVIKGLMTNSYKQLETILTSNSYEHSKEDGSFIYKEVLAGFVQSHVTDYRFNNYMDVDISQVSAYKVITLKQNTIAALQTVQINQDRDISKLISNMDDLVIEVSLSLDNAKTISMSLKNQAEEIKKTVYDIEHGAIENFTDLGIDKRIDELLRLKLSIDYIKMNVDIALDYLTNLVVFLGLICDIDN
jgi:hypothetical protein